MLNERLERGWNGFARIFLERREWVAELIGWEVNLGWILAY